MEGVEVKNETLNNGFRKAIAVFGFAVITFFAFYFYAGTSKETKGGHTLNISGKPEEKSGTLKSIPEDLSVIIWKRAIDRYIMINGAVPDTYDDIRKSHLLFFEPSVSPTKWQAQGDQLTVELEYEGKDGKATTKVLKRYKPGSQNDLENKERLRKEMWKTYKQYPDLYPQGLKEEEFMNGTFSLEYYDKLSTYAWNSKELEQILWSDELANLLTALATHFQGLKGRFPKTLDELVKWVGSTDEEAWKAPITGKKPGQGTTADGSNLIYRPTEDLQGFALYVPLYGAGTNVPREGMRFSESSGYNFPVYIRRSVGIGVGENTSWGY